MASLTTPLPPGLLPEPGSVPPVAAPEFSLGAPAGEQQPGFIVGQVRAAYEDLDAIAAGFQSSLVGTAIRSTIPAIVDRVSNWQLDPSFSARHPKYFNDQWLGEHPWMIEAYANGSADTIPNETAFAHFMSRAEEDWNIRSRLGQAGFGRQIVGGIIGGIPDFILGGMVARGVGVAGYLERAREWATTGGYLERAIKASTIGAAGNLSYDAAIRAASPSSREPWTADEAANTAMVGAGFGLGLASLSMLAGTARGRNLAGRIGDAVANPELTTLAEAAKKDADAALARVSEIEANRAGMFGIARERGPSPQIVPEQSGLLYDPALARDRSPIGDAAELSMLAERSGVGFTPEQIAQAESALPGEFIPREPPPEPSGQPIPNAPSQQVRDDLLRAIEKDYGGPAPEGMTAQTGAVPAKFIDIGEFGSKLRISKKAAISAQQEAVNDLMSGQRTVIAVPKDSEVTADAIDASRFKQIDTKNGRLIFDKSLYSGADIMEAAKNDKVGELLKPVTIVQTSGPRLGGTLLSQSQAIVDPGIFHRFGPFEHPGVKETPSSFVITPETAPKRAAFELRGGTFVEHPAQAWHDLQATQNELARASTGSKFSDALRAAFGIATPATKRIGEALPKLTREAGRLFFDFTDPTTEHVKNPVTVETGIPAESLKWNIDNEHDALVKTTSAAYQLWRDEQGKKITQGGRSEFDTAITDYMRAQDEFRRGARTTLPEVSPNVATAAKAMSEYAKAQAERMRDVGLLAEDASHNPWYITRRWNVPEIIRRRTEVESLLADQLKLNRERDFNTGAKIDPDTRTLEMEAIEHGRKDRAPGDLGLDAEERAAIKRTIAEFQKNEAELTPGGGVGKPPKEMTEGDLKSLTKGLFGQDLYQRYLQEVDLWHRGKIRSWIDDMSKPSEGHGVESALSNPSPIKGRVLKVNESNFADFLDRDAQELVNAYHAKMAGEIAARQAIKASAERWSPLVLKSTGKVLSEEAYNPDLILQAVADDSATWLKAAEQTGDQKRVDQVRAENKKSYAALSGKLDQLRRKGPAGPESPLWRFISMQVAKMTQIGLMGKTGIAALAETASVMPALHPDRRSMELFRQAMNFAKELSVPEMQAFEVATRDIALLNRDVEISGLTDAFGRERFGPGRAGRAMTAIDRATSRASDTFMRITGLPRITSNARNAMSVVVMNKVIAGARKMAVAQGLIEKGMSEAEAVVKAGLSAEEATNLSRLGFDGKRAAKLTSLIEQHGRDYHGNAVTPDTADWVHPNAHAWADANPDIWNRLRHAVNSEVMDQIVEPKVLSRAGTAGTPLGRVFHQFMSFAYAWGNQFYPMLARQPAGAQARFLMFSLASAAMADALYNALSGRRSLDQTAEQWGSNPAGMVYGAIMRSAWPGWFQRPLGLLEFTTFGPAKLLGNQNLSTVYGRKDMNLGTLLGPGGSWINNVITAGQKAINEGSFTPSSNRALWNAMPFHNLWQLEAANRISEWMGGPTLMGPEPRRAP